MQISVIGAGIAGLTCALELAERGARVEVLERGEGLGANGCSWYAGGMLAPWCELESAEPLIEHLGVESIAWWRKRYPGTVMQGSLVVAHGRDTGELAQFAQRAAASAARARDPAARTHDHATGGAPDAIHADWRPFEWVNGEGIAALEPDLAGRFNKSLFFRDEGHLDPRAALGALEQQLTTLGVPIRYGVAATPRRAGVVVDCTGLAARNTLTDLRGVKGEMLLLRSRDITLARPVRVLHPRIPLYIVPRGDGLFMVGATMIESDQPSRISARSMLELLSAAYALHPAFGEAEIVEIGTGVRPAFPDNLPRIRQRDGVLYINGLYRHGFLAAPALARRAAEVVLQNRHFPEVMDEDSRERRLA